MRQSGSDGARIEISEADTTHVALLAPLFDAYRQFYHQPADLGSARDFLFQRLARSESVIFLASLADSDAAPEAVGFVQLYPSFSSVSLKRVWILYDLFVAPHARRVGVGRALLERARAVAVSTQAGELTLQTAVDNHAAQALYDSLGWKRDDEYLTYVLPL